VGVFATDNRGAIVEKATYPRDPKQIASALGKQAEGELSHEVSKVVEGLVKRGFKRINLTNRRLGEAVKERYSLEVDVRESLEAEERIREALPALAKENGVAEDQQALNDLSGDVSNIMAAEAVRRALSDREALITQTTQLLGELDTALNGLSSRVREWYGLHFPELSRIVKDHVAYAKIVTEAGDRSGLNKEMLEKLGLQRREVSSILSAMKRSMGGDLSQDDLAEIQRFASHIIETYEYRNRLTDYVSRLAEETAPNLSVLAGPVLAAKLIEKAGGIRRLAMMPSGTIQILGAEKAMYRALKTKSKPPKHGLIFQHPYVNAAPRGERGIRARHFAAKLALAARADAFTGNQVGEQLKEELERSLIKTPESGQMDH
jgi:nucleolar protein 56